MKPKETTCNALNVRGINKIPINSSAWTGETVVNF